MRTSGSGISRSPLDSGQAVLTARVDSAIRVSPSQTRTSAWQGVNSPPFAVAPRADCASDISAPLPGFRGLRRGPAGQIGRRAQGDSRLVLVEGDVARDLRHLRVRVL